MICSCVTILPQASGPAVHVLIISPPSHSSLTLFTSSKVTCKPSLQAFATVTKGTCISSPQSTVISSGTPLSVNSPIGLSIMKLILTASLALPQKSVSVISTNNSSTVQPHSLKSVKRLKSKDWLIKGEQLSA